MTASVTLCHFTTSSTLMNHPILKKPQLNPPLQIHQFSQKPIKTPSFKEVGNHASLKEAFQTLTRLFPAQNQFCPEEAYSSILELCASKKAVSLGQQAHAHMIKSFAVCESVFLSTRLVFMYGKCGSILSAEKVFDKMPQRTIFTWNAMIGAYVSNGEPLGALSLYREMRVLGIPLDSCTFPCLLKACGALNNLRCGAEIHGLAIKCGYDSIIFIVNSIVAMYAKCSNVDGARRLFDGMTEKEDIVSWNSIISAYASNGQSVEALGLFRDMQKGGLAMNTYTSVAALQACEDSFFVKLGMEIHAAILKASHDVNVYVVNALIAMYARCGKMDEAARIFYKMDDKDFISWNTLLSGFVQNGLYEEALKFFHDMKAAGRKPDQVSVLNVIAASGRLGNLLNGMELHAYTIRCGFDSDLQVGNTLIDMYAKCRNMNYMGRAFERMTDKDFISWTTIIAGYAQSKAYSRALELFSKVRIQGMDVDEMMIASILLACGGLKNISYVKEIHGYILRRGLSDLALQNSIVDVYGECKNTDYAKRMALELVYFMRETSVEPDSIALVSLLSAAASLSALKKGKEIHGFLIRKGFIIEGSLANSLVDMYARCGVLENSYMVFNCIRHKSLALWTSMINANGMHGRGNAAVDLLNRMKDENIVPDHITFLALLNACSHSGFIDEGRRFLEVMQCEYHLEPWPEHYACLVDLLGRANRLEEAYQFVKTMQIQPTAEVWCALLGACQVHSNKELGQIAAQKLLELGPENPGNYVLVSNVFAASGRWKDVEEVRMRMKGSGLKKNPGCSWVEVDNKVHAFVARDQSHPQSDEIYHKLAQITDTLEREGYVAQTKYVLHNVEEEQKVKMLYGHSERLAIAYGLLGTPNGTPVRVTKNLRVCGDCHTFCKLVSKIFGKRACCEGCQ
uniref:DYW domain-containing protein n=1 Tax=Fagus sylvatica TaxID=28930 RepID=A0A2N9G6I8_FAGSY